jgi:hypothetical protein
MLSGFERALGKLLESQILPNYFDLPACTETNAIAMALGPFELFSGKPEMPEAKAQTLRKNLGRVRALVREIQREAFFESKQRRA